jgi:hypothetical protein
MPVIPRIANLGLHMFDSHWWDIIPPSICNEFTRNSFFFLKVLGIDLVFFGKDFVNIWIEVLLFLLHLDYLLEFYR